MKLAEKQAKMDELCALRDAYEIILNDIAEIECDHFGRNDFVLDEMIGLDNIVTNRWANVLVAINELEHEWCDEDSNIDLY